MERGPRPVPEEPDFDILNRHEAQQPDLTEAQRTRKASEEARAARDRDNNYHARKCELGYRTFPARVMGCLPPGCACTVKGLQRAGNDRQPAAGLPRARPLFSALSRPARRARTARVHRHPSLRGNHPDPVVQDRQLCRGLPGAGENKRLSAAVAAVLAAHPDLRARLEAIPRYLSDTNMVDHVGQQLQTAVSNMLTLLFADRLKKSVPLAGAKFLMGADEHQRRSGVMGLGGGHLPAWSKRQCTFVRRMVCGLDVSWLLQKGGVVVTPAMQAEVVLQWGLLQLREGEKVDDDWLEESANRGRLLRHAVHTTRDGGRHGSLAAGYGARAAYRAADMFRNGALPDPEDPGEYIEEPKDSQKLASPKNRYAQTVDTDGVAISVMFLRPKPAGPPADLPQMGKGMGTVNPLAHLHAEWLGVDPGKTNMATVAHEERSADGSVLIKQAKQQWPDRILALVYGAAGFNGSDTIGCRGVPVKQMLRKALKQFPAGRVVMVDGFRTSRVSSANNTPNETLLDMPRLSPSVAAASEVQGEAIPI
ncbi:hypothetical protein QJQ45_022215 [Haematococcus lacustris]|nr:hypothetical protein QJQ45_022215 [Haematococcus lacustris]